MGEVRGEVICGSGVEVPGLVRSGGRSSLVGNERVRWVTLVGVIKPLIIFHCNMTYFATKLTGGSRMRERGEFFRRVRSEVGSRGGSVATPTMAPGTTTVISTRVPTATSRGCEIFREVCGVR